MLFDILLTVVKLLGCGLGDISSAHDVETRETQGAWYSDSDAGEESLYTRFEDLSFYYLFHTKTFFFFLERHLFVIKSCWTIVKMQTFWNIFYHLFVLFKQSLIKAEAY